MKVTYELSVEELKEILEWILKGLTESEAFEKVVSRRFEVKP